jgi:outer membrane protein TolC
MRRQHPHTTHARISASGLTIALTISASLIHAQTANVLQLAQPGAPNRPPATLTLKDALALAEKNDPAMHAAAGDAASAREDRMQARAALYPSFSGRSEYLGTQGDGKLASGRYVTNDGVHVYRDWAVMHQDLSPGTLKRVAEKRASSAEAWGRAQI